MIKIFITEKNVLPVEHYVFKVPPEGISIHSEHSFGDILIACKDDCLLNWQENHGEDWTEGLLYQAVDHMKEIGDIKVNNFSIKPIEDKEITFYFTVQRN